MESSVALLAILERWARRAKTELRTLQAIAKHPRTPRTVKLLAAGLAAYALSPIDLIPDFIPILGYLDDVLLLPLGIHLALKLIPAAVLSDARRAAQQADGKLPRSPVAAIVIISLWIISAVVVGTFALRLFDAK
jgi:uncharacterized membrane protein YkvA (DUF1232 family)